MGTIFNKGKHLATQKGSHWLKDCKWTFPPAFPVMINDVGADWQGKSVCWGFLGLLFFHIIMHFCHSESNSSNALRCSSLAGQTILWGKYVWLRLPRSHKCCRNVGNTNRIVELSILTQLFRISLTDHLSIFQMRFCFIKDG